MSLFSEKMTEGMDEAGGPRTELCGKPMLTGEGRN